MRWISSESIGKLFHLAKLVLESCEALSALPEFIGELVNLKELNLLYCKSLRALPESIGKLVLAINVAKPIRGTVTLAGVTINRADSVLVVNLGTTVEVDTNSDELSAHAVDQSIDEAFARHGIHRWSISKPPWKSL